MNTAKELIINELLPIYQTTDTGEKVVDGRELCGFLNVGTRYNDWIKNRIEKYEFVQGDDFIALTENLVSGGKQSVHILKLDMAKELAMVENNEQGRKARKHFIEVEKRYTGQVPTSPPPYDQPSFPEYDNMTKLMNMLRMGIRDHLFNEETESALRSRIAEMVLGHPVFIASPGSDGNTSATPRNKDERPQWVKDGYGAKTIGFMCGQSATKVGIVAKKQGFQSPEYGAWYEYTRNGRPCKVFIYNETAKDKLLELLGKSS